MNEVLFKTEMESEPLVTVIVLTFNSGKYVLETLESIELQDYRNIELIISDDCSVDNTIELCEAWLQNKSKRFSVAKVLKPSKNRGVAINCDEAWREATGKWIKYIAGDDLLLPTAITTYVDFILHNKDIQVVVSELEFFGEKNGKFTLDVNFNYLSTEQQLKRLLLTFSPVIGPSGFMSKSSLEKIRGFDTRVKMIEDYPLSLKYLSNGIKIYVLNQTCVKYRLQKGSISTADDFYKKFWDMYEQCALPIIRNNSMYLIYYHYLVSKLGYEKIKKHSLMHFFYLLMKIFDVYSLIPFLKKTLNSLK